MEFEFLEIGETLASGSIFLLAIWNLYYLINHKNGDFKWNQLPGFDVDYIKLGYTAIFLSITYLIGLVIENIATDVK